MKLGRWGFEKMESIRKIVSMKNNHNKNYNFKNHENQRFSGHWENKVFR